MLFSSQIAKTKLTLICYSKSYFYLEASVEYLYVPVKASQGVTVLNAEITFRGG